jgi:hypothetical protein
LRARVEEAPGQPSIGRLRDELHTSRRHAEAILAALGDRPPVPRRGPSPRRRRPSR